MGILNQETIVVLPIALSAREIARRCSLPLLTADEALEVGEVFASMIAELRYERDNGQIHEAGRLTAKITRAQQLMDRVMSLREGLAFDSPTWARRCEPESEDARLPGSDL